MQRARIEVVARDHVVDERVDIRIVRVALRHDLFFEHLPLRRRGLRLLRLRKGTVAGKKAERADEGSNECALCRLERSREVERSKLESHSVRG